MIHRLEIYLDQVLAYANLRKEDSENARNELNDHLLTRIEELEKQGAARDDAVFRAIHDHGRPSDVGYGLRGGFPLVDVRLRGTARGVIAVGPKAIGVFSCGLVSTGVMSCGLLSFGVFNLGLIAIGLFAFGSITIGFLSFGMNAIGFVAIGFNAAGILSAGLNAAGFWVFAGDNSASYFNDRTVPDWLVQLGYTCNLNFTETALCFLPILVFFVLTISVSTVRAIRERRRLADCQSWVFE